MKISSTCWRATAKWCATRSKTRRAITTPARAIVRMVRSSIPHVIGYNYDMAEGVDYEIDLTQPPGRRIRNLRWHGKPLEDDQPLRIAVNNYRAGGSAGYSMFRGAKIVWRSPDEIRDLVIQYYSEHKTLPAHAGKQLARSAGSRSPHFGARGAGGCANRNTAVITDSHFSAVMFVNAGRPSHVLRAKVARAGGRRDRKTASSGPAQPPLG